MSHLTCLSMPRTLGNDTILSAKSLSTKPFVLALVSAILYIKDWFLYQVLQSVQLISYQINLVENPQGQATLYSCYSTQDISRALRQSSKCTKELIQYYQ